MEYDRAPHVLSYQRELAGHAPDQPTDGGRTDRQHPHQDGAEHPLRTRHQVLPQGDQGARRGDGRPQSQGQRLPPRVELYHLAERTKSGAVISGRRLSVYARTIRGGTLTTWPGNCNFSLAARAVASEAGATASKQGDFDDDRL